MNISKTKWGLLTVLFLAVMPSQAWAQRGGGGGGDFSVDISTFLIQDVNSNKCWHIQGGSSANRTPVWTWDCRPDMPRFRFQLVPATRRSSIQDGQPVGWFYIVDQNSGKCLHSRGGGYADREPLWLWDCQAIMGTDIADRGTFKFVPARGNSYKIKVRSSGKCMHVRGASHADRTEIWTWSCLNPAPNHMRFRLLPLMGRQPF